MTHYSLHELSSKVYDAEKQSFNHTILEMLQKVDDVLRDLDTRVNTLENQDTTALMSDMTNIRTLVTDIETKFHQDETNRQIELEEHKERQERILQKLDSCTWCAAGRLGTQMVPDVPSP